MCSPMQMKYVTDVTYGRAASRVFPCSIEKGEMYYDTEQEKWIKKWKKLD